MIKVRVWVNEREYADEYTLKEFQNKINNKEYEFCEIQIEFYAE